MTNKIIKCSSETEAKEILLNNSIVFPLIEEAIFTMVKEEKKSYKVVTVDWSYGIAVVTMDKENIPETFEKLLDWRIEIEDYEKASILRDFKNNINEYCSA